MMVPMVGPYQTDPKPIFTLKGHQIVIIMIITIHSRFFPPGITMNSHFHGINELPWIHGIPIKSDTHWCMVYPWIYPFIGESTRFFYGYTQLIQYSMNIPIDTWMVNKFIWWIHHPVGPSEMWDPSGNPTVTQCDGWQITMILFFTG